MKISGPKTLHLKSFKNKPFIIINLSVIVIKLQIRQAVADDKSKLAEESESDCTSKEEILEAPPTNAQMREALRILRRGVQHRATNFQRHYEYEQFIQ